MEWVDQLGGTNNLNAWTIETDSKANIFVGGDFKDSADFNPDPKIYLYLT